MNEVQRFSTNYDVITRAVNDMGGRTASLRHMVFAGVAFLAPMAIGVAAFANAA